MIGQGDLASQMDYVRSDDISTSESDLYKYAGDLYRSPELLMLAAGRCSFETRTERPSGVPPVSCSGITETPEVWR